MREDLRTSTTRWYARGLNNGAVFGATYRGVARLPRQCSYGIGYVGTWLAYHLMRDGTQALLANLRVVRPDASPRELGRLALLTYRSYARDTIDFIRGLSTNAATLSRSVAQFDSGRFDELLAEGKGVILLGGHFGNWELGGVALRLLRGYPLSVVGRPEASPVVGRIRQQMRESLGIETIEIGQMLDTALQIRRILAGNSVVAMLIDRHLGRDRVDVRFFGRTTGFLRSPAMIAYLSGAPMLPSFMVRQGDGRFSAVCGETIRVDGSLPPDAAVATATQAFATQLEARIRTSPHLWYQFYPYFDEPAQAT
jgi:KDO2-lipid IV(A) lauroyltransferase